MKKPKIFGQESPISVDIMALYKALQLKPTSNKDYKLSARILSQELANNKRTKTTHQDTTEDL